MYWVCLFYMSLVLLFQFITFDSINRWWTCEIIKSFYSILCWLVTRFQLWMLQWLNTGYNILIYCKCKYMYRNYSTQIMYSYSPFDNLHDIHQQTENLTYISYLWEMWHRRSDTLHITVSLDSSDKQHVVYIYSFVFYILLYYRARDGRRFIRD